MSPIQVQGMYQVRRHSNAFGVVFSPGLESFKSRFRSSADDGRVQCFEYVVLLLHAYLQGLLLEFTSPCIGDGIYFLLQHRGCLWPLGRLHPNGLCSSEPKVMMGVIRIRSRDGMGRQRDARRLAGGQLWLLHYLLDDCNSGDYWSCRLIAFDSPCSSNGRKETII